MEEKQKENIELTSICDDLISKVGSWHRQPQEEERGRRRYAARSAASRLSAATPPPPTITCENRRPQSSNGSSRTEHHQRSPPAHLLESSDGGATSDGSRSDISVMVRRRSRRHGLVRQQTFSVVPTSAIHSAPVQYQDSVPMNSPSIVVSAVSPARPLSAGFSMVERRINNTAAAANNYKRPRSGPPTVLKSPRSGTTNHEDSNAADFRRHSHANCHNQKVAATTPTLGRRLGERGRALAAAEMTSPPRSTRLFWRSVSV